MNRPFLKIFLFFSLAVSLAANAVEKNTGLPEAKKLEAHHYRKMIADYQAFLKSVPENVRKEVDAYRRGVVKQNEEKQRKYNLLSEQAKEVLRRSVALKKKLPLDAKKIVLENMQ